MAVIDAGIPLRGSDGRVQKAIAAKAPLDACRDRVIELVEGRHGGFRGLPLFVHPDIDLEGARALVWDPCRGIFPLSDDRAVALLFTVEPHDLTELISRFPRKAANDE